jgi:hypothetical protein
MIKLSILLPTFLYPQGVERILSLLSPLPEGIELLVADNSPDGSVRAIIEQHNDPRMRYWHNPPIGGAAGNWNTLLDRASGEYILLLHHDEVPLGPNYLERLCAAIEKSDADVMVQKVVLMDADLRPMRNHVPTALRDWVIRHAPGYLFRRNLIGPTAALVVRRELYPRFTPDLRWLVDVELYVRLRQSTASWQALPGLRMGSVQDTHQTLTATLKPELKAIDKAEREQLLTVFPQAAPWLGTLWAAPLRAGESVLWTAFRVVQAVISRIAPPKGMEAE